MGFIVILILTTLSIAGSAAFFSIYGLAQIFTGSFWPVVVMASSLEAGKLVSASYLYRYWNTISKLMKGYLFIAIFILMAITSAGVFGFLSAAYQQDILPLELNEQKIQLLLEEKEEIELLKQQRRERRLQIDADIAKQPEGWITARQRLLESYSSELQQLHDDIGEYTKRTREITEEIQKLKGTNLEQKAHIGPIIYIANAFKASTDEATKWVILLIIFAFDPLAVILTVGANIAVIERKGGRGYLTNKPAEERVSIDHDKVTIEEEHATPIVVNQGMTAEELEELLEKRFSEHDLSPSEQLQKTMVEEMLAKKKIKERYRNPKS